MVTETAGREFLLTRTITFFEQFILYLIWNYYVRAAVGRRWTPNHRVSGHISHARSCVRRDYPSEVMKIVSYCTKSGRMSWKLVSGRYLSITKCCLTTLMAFNILDITWAVGYFVNLCVGLHGPGWLYVLGMTACRYLRLWTPRARATDLGQGPHLCRGVRAGPLSIARETTGGWKRKECRCAKKRLYIVIQGSPSGCVWHETPGVTQVDEKRHEGNTAVVTAHLGWRKHGHRNSRTGVPTD